MNGFLKEWTVLKESSKEKGMRLLAIVDNKKSYANLLSEIKYGYKNG